MITSPISGQRVEVGQPFTVSYSPKKNSPAVDTCIVMLGQTEVARFTGNEQRIAVPSDIKMGNQTVSLILKGNGKQLAKYTTTVKVHPKRPAYYDYKVVNSYPHDTNAYTQGLFIYNGELFESTGRNGESSLRRVDLKSGKVMQHADLDKQYFGEGADILDGKIYQLTWESRVGFIYNANTFERVGQFSYPTEGWGLTTDGEMLIMSDGSSTIRFMKPDDFTEVRAIEAYTHEGSVNYLNELEYIDGMIWANVYGMDAIVCIDPKTGAITKVVDLRNLLPNELRTPETDVLNGIAYDKDTKRLYVTGKLWSKLYEIELVERSYE